MLKQIAFALLLFSVSFSLVGAQCHDFEQYCKQEACEKAGGEPTPFSTCSKPPDFDGQAYQEELDNCAMNYEYCIQNNGLAEDMTCCGPMFIFLSALLALYAGGTR